MVLGTLQAGVTPLCTAVSIGSMPMVQALLAHKARTHRATLASRVPLHVAACGGRGDLVVALLEGGADPDEMNQDGDYALVMAAHSGHPKVVQLLLNRKAQVDRPTQSVRFGGTPLMAAAAGLSYATGGDHLWVLHALLTKGAQVNRTDHVGRTALYIAAVQMPASGQCPPFVLAGVQLLLRQGADMRAVLDMAAARKQTRVRDVLLLAFLPALTAPRQQQHAAPSPLPAAAGAVASPPHGRA